MSKRPRYEGDPTLARVMVRPRWILALLLSLAVGAGFAWLAQWQLGSAVKLEETKIDSETTYALHEITSPGSPVHEEVGGRMVEAELQLVPGDSVVVGSRMNQGEEGFWVVSHFASPDGSEHLAVAVGWAASLEAAEAQRANIDSDETLASPHRVEGRYLPSEGPSVPAAGEPLDTLGSVSTGQLINLWQEWQGEAFSGYLVAAEAPAGLEVIDSFAPLPEEKINWLNLFYAVEWVVFAGFAIFFWYRLAKDAWEKEHELMALHTESSAGTGVQ